MYPVSSIIFTLALFAPMTVLAQGSAAVDVVLSPAGSFRAESKKVTGVAYKTKDGGVQAKNVKVDLRGLATGISLRDDHTRKRLQTSKYPYAKVIKATGKNGVGKALVEIKGIKKEVTGTYKIVGNELQAEFPMKLKDLKITDVSYMGVGVEDEVKLQVTLPLKEVGRMPASNKSKNKKK